MSEEITKVIGKAIVRTSLAQAAKYAVTAGTGNAGLGEAAGHVTGASYDHIPDPVKVGAGAGGVLCVHMGTHMIAAGTAGSIAAGTATLAAFLPFVAVGATIGGALWVIKKLCE